MNEVKITFGICTYNRKDILSASIKSLSNVYDINSVNIRVYDDCSTEFDEQFLHDLFPCAKTIKRFETNGGADKNTSRMYEDFLNSDDEWLFNADSDLIYRTDIIYAIKSYINNSKRFITFFNCINHNTIKDLGDIVIKDSVGAAGCLLHRTVVKLILNSIKMRNIMFDVRFSKLLRKHGINLYSTKESYVQHIGVSGFNSRGIKFDYGLNFHGYNALNAEIIENTFEAYAFIINKYKSKISWKIYNFIVSFPRRLRKLIKISMEILHNA